MPNKLSEQDFMTKALVKNGSLDLSKSKYINTRTKVLVGCRTCRFEWNILPKALFNKEIKCPRCTGRDRTNSNFSEMPMTLYFIRIRTEMETEPEYIYKIGITKYNVNNRFDLDDLRKINILLEKRFERGEDAYNLEQKLHGLFSEYRYYGKFKLASHGNTELLTINPMDYLKEKENLNE